MPLYDMQCIRIARVEQIFLVIRIQKRVRNLSVTTFELNRDRLLNRKIDLLAVIDRELVFNDNASTVFSPGEAY